MDTLGGNLHSGQFGGAAPDALAALIRMLASLRDESGATTVDGLDAGGEWTGLAYEEADFRRDAKVLDGVELIGTGTVADRLWARPAVTVLGIDAPPVVGATPSVQAEARRPGERTAAAGLRRGEGRRRAGGAPAGGGAVGREGGGDAAGQRAAVRARTPPARRTPRWRRRCGRRTGEEMAVAGQGGSIPLCNTLAALYPTAEILLIGLSEPRGADPRGQRERVAGGVGADVVDGGAVPQGVRGVAVGGAGGLRSPGTGRGKPRGTVPTGDEARPVVGGCVRPGACPGDVRGGVTRRGGRPPG